MPAPDSKLVSAALGKPWAISEDGLRRVVDALQSREGKPLQGARKATVTNGVAVIPVEGPLSKKSSWMQEFFGGSSYESIAKDFVTALDDSGVTSIILDIDSPGGEVSGCGELSALIYAARGKKKIVSYVSGQMCSAAFWLGSAADEIVADPSSMLGSIGVRTSLVDASGMYQQIGVRVYDLAAKQSPLKITDPASADDRARVVDSLSAMCEVFLADVARNRKVSTATVIADYGKGDVLIGRHAVESGLANRLGDMETLLASLSFGSTTNPVSAKAKTKGKTMSMKNAKCNGCDDDFDDDDATYCSGCKGSKASALDAQIVALTGKADPVEAMGVLAAWKNVASEMVEIRARAAEQEKNAAALAFEAAIATAKNMRLLAVSDDHKRNKAALEFKGSPDAIKGLKSFLSALDPLSAPAAEDAAKEKTAEAAQVAPAAHGFSDEAVKALAKVQKQTGSKFTLEQLAAHRALLARTINPSEEN